ncbi:MAG: IS1595 family transposase [Hellea sp.]
MTFDITNPIFTDKEAARLHLEATRWPEGAVCPHCKSKNVRELNGKSHRAGLRQCNEKECRQQFTVTVGTVFERSKVPLNKWLLTTHLMTASKKGMSAHQIHRMIGVTYKTAWFMCHRIREAMTDNNPPPLGGKDKVIEADETYIGNKVSVKENQKQKHYFTDPVTGEKKVYRVGGKRGASNKYTVVSLVERGGSVRSFHVDKANQNNIREILVRNADRKSKLMTDESHLYKRVGQEYERHEHVIHSKKEYVRGDVYTNTLEGFYSIFKRGMIGTYQHCGESHLQRYVTEFDFRYNGRKMNDNERRDEALKGIEGKRLTYRRINKAA